MSSMRAATTAAARRGSSPSITGNSISCRGSEKSPPYVGLGDISDVEVDKATTDLEWKDGVLHLTNLDIRKNDVTRIAGAVDVDANNQVDGKIKLGLPSTATAKWPQLQDKGLPGCNSRTTTGPMCI